ncbi:MAG: hypothetical protein K2L07_13450 [Lachnospiraceae bacterium]|nr:hypothetical protein [Lachnospiraceae bacterium]
MKKNSFIDNINSLLDANTLQVVSTLRGEFLAMLEDGERYQMFPLSSKAFQFALKACYQKNYHNYLSSNNMKEIIFYLESKAFENKLDYELVNRIYNADNEFIIYDLNKETGEAVFIEDGECTISTLDQLLFKRNDIFRNQITPNLKKSIKPEDLPKYVKKHFNLSSKDEVKLFSLYLVSCFWGLTISHPALFISSEQGSGKSTFLRKLERLIDPKTIDLIGIPHKADDLELRLSNSYFVALDNLSYVSRSISDILARAITGGSITKRELYENTKEVCFNIKCVLALNSVSMIFKEPDILDRMFIISLARFKSSKNRSEAEIWKEFEEDIPAILGCCFKCLAIALNDKEPIPPVDKIRLADYHDCCIRIGKVLGYSPEEVTRLLFMNQKRVSQESVNESIAAQCLIEFMEERDFYVGSVSELYHEIKMVAKRKFIDVSLLPQGANHFSKQINKVKNILESEYGIAYTIRNCGVNRKIRVNKIDENIDNIDSDEDSQN